MTCFRSFALSELLQLGSRRDLHPLQAQRLDPTDCLPGPVQYVNRGQNETISFLSSYKMLIMPLSHADAVHRTAEAELFPVLRKFGISFYEFNPLGGGFFTGRYKDMNSSSESGARFDPETQQGKMYRQRYWNESKSAVIKLLPIPIVGSFAFMSLLTMHIPDTLSVAYFKALDIIDKAVQKEGLTMPEVALRWVSHHSAMKAEHGGEADCTPMSDRRFHGVD